MVIKAIIRILSNLFACMLLGFGAYFLSTLVLDPIIKVVYWFVVLFAIMPITNLVKVEMSEDFGILGIDI